MAEQSDVRRDGLKGRVLWALNELEKAGERGITSRQYPGVRLSDCIFKLRRAGFPIETIREAHDGPFPGSHGRYRLGSIEQSGGAS